MFGYFRLFSFISLIVIIGFTIVAGTLFRNVAIDGLHEQIEKSGNVIAKSYIHAVWKNNSEAVLIFNEGSFRQDLSNPETAAVIQGFAKETIKYFSDMPIIRVNIYNSSGALLISSDINSDLIFSGESASPDAEFIKNNFFREGGRSQAINKIHLKNGSEGSILQTIVPVMRENVISKTKEHEGAVEIILDLAAPSHNLFHIQIMGTVYIIGFFILYLGLLYFMARRIEVIITKQHEVNVELAAAAAAAQAENNEKSQFLANVSHELRTPLNSIIGFSEIIKNSLTQGMSEEKFSGYINDIHASGVHLLSLINDILDYSKAEAGKLELEVSEVNLNKLVHSCVRLVTPRADSAQVLLVEALPKEILNIVTDSKRFKQILLNLLSNAIKFTPAGGEVRITAWADINNDTYMFEVKDSGIGIAPKDISRAMAPFGQVDNTLSRKYEGTGLGLPLTKKLVELMGGKFEIESEVGVGTTIRFSVPCEVKGSGDLVVKNAM